MTIQTTQTIQQRLRAAGFESAKQVRTAMESTGDPGAMVALGTIQKVLGAGPDDACLHESSLKAFHLFLSLVGA